MNGGFKQLQAGAIITSGSANEVTILTIPPTSIIVLSHTITSDETNLTFYLSQTSDSPGRFIFTYPPNSFVAGDVLTIQVDSSLFGKTYVNATLLNTSALATGLGLPNIFSYAVS